MVVFHYLAKSQLDGTNIIEENFYNNKSNRFES